MKIPSSLIGGFFVLVLFTSCNKLPLSGTPFSETPHLEASELAQAQGVYWWQVTLPQNISEKDQVRVAYVFPDGRTDPSYGGMSGYKPGQKVKVFCRQDQSRGALVTTMIGRTGSMMMPLSDRLKEARGWTYPVAVGQQAFPGDILLKFSTGKGVTSSQVLQPDEVGLAVLIEKKP